MKVLLSAFACSPYEGSEPGVGWNWAVEIAKLGHEVVVLTRDIYRDVFARAEREGLIPGRLRVAYHEVPYLRKWRRGGLYDHAWSLAWQVSAVRTARALHAAENFDLVHHITYGTLRQTTRLYQLGLPLVLGPAGGGERAPMALRRGYGVRGWMLDGVRDVVNWSTRLDPMSRQAMAAATVIYLKTPMSNVFVPPRFRHKVDVRTEIGTRPDNPPPPPEPTPTFGPNRPIKLLFAARFIYWKGMHLGLPAVAELRRRGVPVKLTMLGEGSQEVAWRRLADQLGIGDLITWERRVPYDRMPGFYRAHDALLFPSLHDSSGNVVLECLSHGVPVVCLALGGPGLIVNDSCGRVVAPGSVTQTVQRLADAVAELFHDPALFHSLRQAGPERAASYSLPRTVASTYADIERRLCDAAPSANARVRFGHESV